MTDAVHSKRQPWWLAIPTAIAVLVLNVAAVFLYMAVYGYLISPGHEPAYYEAHAEAVAPYSSIIAGMPLMFLAGRWIGRRFAPANRIKAALSTWLVYFLIDLAVIVMAGSLSRIFLLFAVSFSTKFVAAYLGGRSSLAAE